MSSKRLFVQSTFPLATGSHGHDLDASHHTLALSCQRSSGPRCHGVALAGNSPLLHFTSAGRCGVAIRRTNDHTLAMDKVPKTVGGNVSRRMGAADPHVPAMDKSVDRVR